MAKVKSSLFIILLLVITLVAYKLRLRDYALVPSPGQSMDEYSNSWVGLSLIRLGFPVGMSGMAGYGFNDTRYINVDRVFQSTARGNPFYLNSPWFDHPPLLGLVTGGYAYLKGARVFEDTLAVIIRKPIIWLGTLSVILVGILAYVLYGWQVSLGSSLLYATLPLVILQSRFIQAENGLVLCFLTNLIFLSSFLKRQKYVFLFFAAVFAGLGTLFKLSGLAIYLTAYLCLFLQSKNLTSKLKDLVFFNAIAIPITSLFLVFGLVMGWSTFVHVQTDNSTRFYGLGMAAIQNLWLEPRITHDKSLADHWPMVLWIGLFLYLYSKLKPEERILPIATISYLIVYLFFGSWPYGWYTIPFWPLLTIIFIHQLIENSSQLKTVFLYSLLLSFPITQILTRFINIRNFQIYANYWRFGLSGLIFILFYLSLKYSSKSSLLNKIWLYSLFLLAIFLNIKFVNTINVDTWLKLN